MYGGSFADLSSDEPDLGFGPIIDESGFGTQLEFLGVIIEFRLKGDTWNAELPLSPDRFEQLIREAPVLKYMNELF